MRLHEVLLLLQDSTPAQWVSKSDHLVGAGLQVVHILGFVMLLAGLLLIALRLRGAVFAQQPVVEVTREVRLLLRWGLAAAAASGVLMFIASAVMYAGKPAFVAKLLVFALALLVQWLIVAPLLRQATPARRAAQWATSLSLLLWFSVAAAGRAIGFT